MNFRLLEPFYQGIMRPMSFFISHVDLLGLMWILRGPLCLADIWNPVFSFYWWEELKTRWGQEEIQPEELSRWLMMLLAEEWGSCPRGVGWSAGEGLQEGIGRLCFPRKWGQARFSEAHVLFYSPPACSFHISLGCFCPLFLHAPNLLSPGPTPGEVLTWQCTLKK